MLCVPQMCPNLNQSGAPLRKTPSTMVHLAQNLVCQHNDGNTQKNLKDVVGGPV